MLQNAPNYTFKKNCGMQLTQPPKKLPPPPCANHAYAHGLLIRYLLEEMRS